MNFEAFIPVFSIIFAIASTATGLGWWLSGQFSHHRKYTYDVVKEMKTEILQKLEYHERHDDQRFDQVDGRIGRLRNDVWEIRLRNAAKDTSMNKIQKDIAKLRNEAEKDNEDSGPES